MDADLIAALKIFCLVMPAFSFGIAMEVLASARQRQLEYPDHAHQFTEHVLWAKLGAGLSVILGLLALYLIIVKGD